MNIIEVAFLLPKLLLLTMSVILVFFIGTMQQQHGFSSIEEETENNNNNPPGFISIKKFDSNGNFIKKWGTEGYADGQFFWLPHDIAIDSSDNVYVVDSGNVHEKKDVCAI